MEACLGLLAGDPALMIDDWEPVMLTGPMHTALVLAGLVVTALVLTGLPTSYLGTFQAVPAAGIYETR